MATAEVDRKQAIRSIKSRRALVSQVVAFCVVNVAMIVIWLATGGGYFWPGWVLLGTGIALVYGFLSFNRRHSRDISEEDIRREMERHPAG
jgi:uncharacterized membrane protein